MGDIFKRCPNLGEVVFSKHDFDFSGHLSEILMKTYLLIF